jgi:Uma2 family endonuclease
MGLPAQAAYMTVEEYMAFEEQSQIRYEYVDGSIYAMTGASKNHARISGNIASRLHAFLEGKSCESYQTEVKVKASYSRYYYPDVVVTCEAAAEDLEDPYLIVQPILLVEVLSPSTQRTDKVEKFNTYQQIPGLLEYLIVAQNKMKVEMYRHRKAGDTWQGEVFTEPNEQITFDSIGLSLTLADIYRRVTFPVPSEGEETL